MTTAAKEPVYPEPESFEPGAAIRLLAQQRALPLAGVAVDGERVRPEAGDRAVVLVSMRDEEEVEQWLITFAVATLNPEEKAQLSESSAEPFELYSSAGGHYVFELDPVAVDVWVAGPLDRDERRVERAVARVREHRARFLVNADFLGLGLDAAADTIVRLRDHTGKVGLGIRNTAFGDEEVRATKARLEDRGVTAEDQRALVGAVPALLEFFRISAQTPGLKDILMEVLDVPWWALAKGLGNVSTNLNLSGERLRVAPDGEGRFILPFAVELNDAPALMVEMEVGPARAPASVLAGVTTVYAGEPKGRGKRISIQLLAATAGP